MEPLLLLHTNALEAVKYYEIECSVHPPSHESWSKERLSTFHSSRSTPWMCESRILTPSSDDREMYLSACNIPLSHSVAEISWPADDARTHSGVCHSDMGIMGTFVLILIATFFCESSEAWELFQELSLKYSYCSLVPETASKLRSSNRLSRILQC